MNRHLTDDELFAKAASELFASLADSGARVDTLTDDDIASKLYGVYMYVYMYTSWTSWFMNGHRISSVRSKLEAMQQ